MIALGTVSSDVLPVDVTVHIEISSFSKIYPERLGIQIRLRGDENALMPFDVVLKLPANVPHLRSVVRAERRDCGVNDDELLRLGRSTVRR